MAKRIENLTLEGAPELFIDNPAEFLVWKTAERIGEVPQFRALFGDSIDGYERMDYSMRALPALRFYNTNYTKESESWFINGDVVADIIFPADLRRRELQQYADTVSGALLQQFRRTNFFVQMCEDVPGLNELGKVFSVNKNGQFQVNEDLVPVTQLTLNFRLDLRVWDEYLTDTLRTVNDPFEVTLGNLALIAARIRGVNDATVTQVEVPQNIRTT